MAIVIASIAVLLLLLPPFVNFAVAIAVTFAVAIITNTAVSFYAAFG